MILGVSKGRGAEAFSCAGWLVPAGAGWPAGAVAAATGASVFAAGVVAIAGAGEAAGAAISCVFLVLTCPMIYY